MSQQPQKAKEFALGDVLSVLTGFVLSPRGLEGVHEIFQHVGGVPFSEEDLDNCRLLMLVQFPHFATSEFSSEVDSLEESLEKTERGTERDAVVEKWLAKQAERYGSVLRIEPISIPVLHSSSIH